MNNGRVIFTNDINQELTELDRLTDYASKFYVYSKRATETPILMAMLPGYEFIPLEEFSNFDILSRDSSHDLFVIKKPHLSNIMDQNIEKLQFLKAGYKLVIDNHPFIGKSETFYSYFPYSFFNKHLMSYMHSYAFRDAIATHDFNPFDVRMLAQQVAPATTTYIGHIFNESEIEYRVIKLTQAERAGYAELKEKLFTQSPIPTPKQVIAKLKRYVDNTGTMLSVHGKQYNLLYPNRIFDLYQRGIKRCVFSDAKVDRFLFWQFRSYVLNANLFMSELWRIEHGR